MGVTESGPPDFETLLLALCGQANGDVHLDLAEIDTVDVPAVVALFRAAATLTDGNHLVLRNPPASLDTVVKGLGLDVTTTRVRLA